MTFLRFRFSYTTTRVINEDEKKLFRCGFAVAPVTRWEYYNTIYTERYMLKPVDNSVSDNLLLPVKILKFT